MGPKPQWRRAASFDPFGRGKPDVLEAMGCIDPRYVSRGHIEKEPYDCLIERPL